MNLDSFGINIKDELGKISHRIGRHLFYGVDTKHFIMRIPSNNSYEYTAFKHNSLIRSLDNGTCINMPLDKFTFSTVNIQNIYDAEYLGSTGDAIIEDKFEYGIHGDLVVIKNKDYERYIRVSMQIVDKSYSNMSLDVSSVLENMYYYLYINDTNNTYETIRQISNANKNTLAENTKTSLAIPIKGRDNSSIKIKKKRWR